MEQESRDSYIRKKTRYFLEQIQEISFPGFERVPIYDVILFFFRGLQKGSLVTRASAIAFNLLFAILPTTIFLFTLIPFIPIPNFQKELLEMLKLILPVNVFDFLEHTLIEVITEKSGGLLLLMFGATLLFSSNGMHALYSAFNATSHDLPFRSWFNQRTISILLVFIITTLLTAAVILTILSQTAMEKLVELEIIQRNLTFYLVRFGKWFIFLALIFLSISFIYYLTPSRKTKWRFISAGSTLATLLFMISSLVFSYFVNHFGRFNSLYGSIGTLIVILIMLYFNSISLLIGFELNASIKSANRKNATFELSGLP